MARSSMYGEEERGVEWSAPGPHRGKGPKGYKPSDERLYEEVSELLTEDGSIDASDIEVEVHDALVTLKGTVESRVMKRRSEEVAELVAGVRDIINELRVRESAPYRTPASEQPSAERRFVDRDAIIPGMAVIDRTGDVIGTVKETRADYFVIDRRLEPDISVDLKAVTKVEDRVYIDADVPERLVRRGDFPKV